VGSRRTASQVALGHRNLSVPNRTSIVSVCYNSSRVLRGFLASIPQGTTIILVDNGSADLAATRALAQSHHALLITNETNVGFGSACNQGAAASNREFLFFLNPDSILQATTIEHLEAAADAKPDASAFNPLITDSRGKPSLKRRSCLLKMGESMGRIAPKSDRPVPVLTGAGLFLRKQTFELISGFDENIFLYHEDDDISMRLRKQIGPTWLIHDARMMHLSGHSSGRSAHIAALKAWHMGRSLVYVTLKHNVSGAFRKALWSAWRQLLSPATLLSKRKFYKNRAFLQGVLSARRDGGAGYRTDPQSINRR
jgi:N-acetylglucosaminyl-diphospho-decaprenol L-rhamnosyltransferase